MQRLFILMALTLIVPCAAHSQGSQNNFDTPKWVGLPQTPVAAKERSDLEDEGIKGKVKKIEYESVEHRSDKPDGTRLLRRIEEFNERGNRLVIKYIRNGSVASALFFGYIDGERASKSEGESSGSGSGSRETKSKDTRYEFKRRYKYKDGKLVEEALISNTGDLWLTYKRNYLTDGIERLVFTKDGKLNQKYFHRYDKDGNEIGFESFDAFKNPNQVRLRGKYTYGAFDAKGNWAERKLSYASLRNDGETYEAYETTYRTITYYD